MAHSFALWTNCPSASTENTSTPLTFEELHLNYWRLPQEPYLLDFGLKFKKKSSNEDNSTIALLLPFAQEHFKLIKDLGKVLSNNQELIRLIFNETSCTLADSGNNTCDIKLGQADTFTLIKELSTDISEEQSDIRQTLIEIKTEGMPAEKALYLRFRLKLSEEAIKTIETHKIPDPKDSESTGFLETRTTIDFRLNEKRLLKDSICGKIKDPIAKIHFFLIQNSYDDMIQHHQEPKRCRLIEAELWSPYINGGKKQLENMMIYHWQKKDDSRQPASYEAFAKLVKRQFNENFFNKVKNKQLWIGLGLGVAGSIFVSGGFEILHWAKDENFAHIELEIQDQGTLVCNRDQAHFECQLLDASNTATEQQSNTRATRLATTDDKTNQ